MQDVPLTNNVAEISNSLFKKCLHQSGPPCQGLNGKKPYEVLLASKLYLESEWQANNLSKYKQGDFEIKADFKQFLELNPEDMPFYHVELPKDTIKEINKTRAGKPLYK